MFENITVKYSTKSIKGQTTQLQGCGHVYGRPAEDLTVGSIMIWNNEFPSRVKEIVKDTKSFITVLEEYESILGNGEILTIERKLKKSRIVARPANEL